MIDLETESLFSLINVDIDVCGLHILFTNVAIFLFVYLATLIEVSDTRTSKGQL